MWETSGGGQGTRDRGEEIVMLSDHSPWNHLDCALFAAALRRQNLVVAVPCLYQPLCQGHGRVLSREGPSSYLPRPMF